MKATQRVLAIPELLALIFTLADKPSNASCARVCKSWSNVALDCLWRDVTCLKHILAILSPLTRERDRDARDLTLNPTYKFERRLTPDGWKRFFEYSNRVRRLEFNSIGSSFALDDTIFAEIALTRPNLNIFPNLLQLRILSPTLRQLEHLIMFLHSNISDFIVDFTCVGRNSQGGSDDGSLDGVKNFIMEIGARMPNLIALDLRMQYPVSMVEGDLCRLLPGLRSLKKIVMPPYTLSSGIMSALSSLPNLGTVQYEYLEEQGKGSLVDVLRFSPELHQGSFPALYDLSFQSTLPDATKFLSMPFAPTNLTILHIQSVQLETAASIRTNLALLAETCQLLTYLALDLHVPLADEVQFTSVDAITFDEHLRPLLSFPNLTTFDFTYPRQLTLTEDDVLEIATKWPSVECLFLNVEPMIDEKPILTFASLIPFAQYCPNLRKLGLFMDATSRVLPILTDHPPPQRFANLTELRVGLSPISEASSNPIALYLSHIFPLGCKLNSGIYSTYDLDDVMGSILSNEQHQTHYQIWDNLSILVPLLTTVRCEERKRSRELEEEVVDLRTRVRILEETRRLTTAADTPSCIPG